MTAVVDTSFLMALTNVEDSHHKRAVEVLRKSPPPKILQPVLAEWMGTLFFAIRKKEGNAAAHQGVRDALQHVVTTLRFPVAPLEHQTRAVDIFMRHHALSFVDAAAIADAPPGQGSLWTFDGRQARVHREERG